MNNAPANDPAAAPPTPGSSGNASEKSSGTSTTPAPVSPSGEPTPWTGDPGFPVAENWMLVDPRWVRKGIPRWLHRVLLSAWVLFVAYLLFLFFFHTPGKEGFHEHPPPGLPGQAPASGAPTPTPSP